MSTESDAELPAAHDANGDQGPSTTQLILGALQRSAKALSSDKDAEPKLSGLAQDQALTGHIGADGIVGGYRLIRRLGRGGMAEVYEAMNPRIKRRVALKILRPMNGENIKELSPRFLREARAMVNVRHPNIITIYDAGEANGLLYMALEYIPGGDLASELKTHGHLSVERAITLIIECAKGLEYLHGAGLIHRDIKPANIFLAEDGTPKIGDFGLARQSSGADRMTVTGASWGTPSFMAPEQIVGAADVDIRADIYALGATLYTLLTGEEPFAGETAYLVTFKAMTESLPDPRKLCPDIPAAVIAVLHTMTARERERRYQNPRQVREDLERVRKGDMLIHASMVGIATDASYQEPLVRKRQAKAPSDQPPPPPIVKVQPNYKWLKILIACLLLMSALWWWSSTSVYMPPSTFRTPTWATTHGTDSIGPWANIAIGSATTRLRYCKATRFTMGSPSDEPQRQPWESQHQVTLTSGFWMQENECDQLLYREVTGKNPSRYQGDLLPVEQVSRTDAQDFCTLLKQQGIPARLPTEAEWEYACRAGSEGSFTMNTSARAWTANNELLAIWQKENSANRLDVLREFCDQHPNQLDLRPHPIAQLPPNRFGLCDMRGNVLEWCADSWDGTQDYPLMTVTNPQQQGRLAIARGGSWFHPSAVARPAARTALDPDTRADYIGFRFIVPDVPTQQSP